MRYKQGFTLIEMMITVAVIGILAVIAVPAYQAYIRYGSTNTCAHYILASRLNAMNLIMLNNGSAAGIDATTLDLTNTNGECAGGVSVSGATAAGGLVISGDSALVSGSYTRRFTMTRAEGNGAWSCETTDGGGAVIHSGSCTDLN
jgi:prepilin-type N-terminal cleavage/methylation domain-containing protein